jgi:hypothetical protein
MDLPDLNFENGLSGTVVDKILQAWMRNGGAKRRRQKLKEGRDTLQAFQDAKKLTVGVMVACGVHSLNDPAVVESVRLTHNGKKEQETKKIRNQRRKVQECIKKVAIHREKKGRGELQGFMNWNEQNCKDYLQYKKNKEDPAMPKGAKVVRARCVTLICRPSPTASPHASDDEAEFETPLVVEEREIPLLPNLAFREQPAENIASSTLLSPKWL